MKPRSVIIGFLPLLAFSAISRRVADNGVGWGAVVASALAVGCLAYERPAWPPKILSVVQLLLFAGLAVAGFAGGAGVDNWLFHWANASVTMALGVIVVVTVPVMPFTEQYARGNTPQEYWTTPVFRQINRVLSLAWGGAIVVMGLSRAAVSAIDQRAASFADASTLDLVFNWAVPIGVIWYMVEFTTTYPDRVTGGDAQAAQH